DEPRPGGGAGALEVLEAAESPVGEGGVECVQDRGALVVGGAGSWLRHEREGIWPTGDVARRAVGDDLARRRNLGTVLEHVLSRSEERRVGKECRSRGWPYDYKEKIVHE